MEGREGGRERERGKRYGVVIALLAMRLVVFLKVANFILCVLVQVLNFSFSLYYPYVKKTLNTCASLNAPLNQIVNHLRQKPQSKTSQKAARRISLRLIAGKHD